MACCDRVSTLNDSTAAKPISAWMTASIGIQLPRIRSSGAAIALPIAMPASTHASMIVKAYAVGRRKITSIRNQMISSASDIKPETKKIHSTSRCCRRCLRLASRDGCVPAALGVACRARVPAVA